MARRGGSCPLAFQSLTEARETPKKRLISAWLLNAASAVSKGTEGTMGALGTLDIFTPLLGISYTDGRLVQDVPDDFGGTISDVATSLSERIRRAMERKGMRPAELARRVGISRASVSDWMSGKTKSLDGENLLRAAEALSVSPRWLQTGFGKEDLAPAQVSDVIASYDVVSVPVLSWEQASMFTPGTSRPVSSETWPVVDHVGPNAFALRQQGSAMEPRIPDSSMVIVDPDAHHEHGHVVLARRPQDMHAVLRQLWFEGGVPSLRPFNATHPTLDMPPSTVVIGRAVFISLVL